MMIRAIYISLALTVPAHAATVALDPGDTGLHWIEGVGFRPVDGLDLWLSKYECPRVGASWKDTVTDRVGRETRCNEPLSGGVTNDGDIDKFVAWPPSKSPQSHLPSAGSFLDRSVWTVWGTLEPVSSPALDPPPAPIPLPATIWLLLAAVAMLWRVRA